MRAIFGPLMIVALLVALWAILFRGNPGGVSDARYAAFERAASPKLLYSCTRTPTREAILQRTRECAKLGRARCEEEANAWAEAARESAVEILAGDGTSTYDELLREARRRCAADRGGMGPGELKVLQAKKD